MSEKIKIPPHTHCRICGKAIPVNREYCSNECKDKETKMQKRNKRMQTLFIIIILVFFILMMITLPLSRPT
ncbi:MAG: DUF2116 family Zn-ribbon domain-containing protein [Nitrososphaerales archaeon]